MKTGGTLKRDEEEVRKGTAATPLQGAHYKVYSNKNGDIVSRI